MMDLDNLAKTLVTLIRFQPEGFTLPLIVDGTFPDRPFSIGEQPTSGYAVAVPGNERTLPDPLHWLDVRSWLVDALPMLRKPGMYIGAWRNEADEIILDVSEVMDNCEAALTAALERGESAIYDLHARTTNYV